jgi:hypothetical protein
VDANVVLGLFSDALSTAVTYVALITWNDDCDYWMERMKKNEIIAYYKILSQNFPW